MKSIRAASFQDELQFLPDDQAFTIPAGCFNARLGVDLHQSLWGQKSHNHAHVHFLREFTVHGYFPCTAVPCKHFAERLKGVQLRILLQGNYSSICYSLNSWHHFFLPVNFLLACLCFALNCIASNNKVLRFSFHVQSYIYRLDSNHHVTFSDNLNFFETLSF